MCARFPEGKVTGARHAKTIHACNTRTEEGNILEFLLTRSVKMVSVKDSKRREDGLEENGKGQSHTYTQGDATPTSAQHAIHAYRQFAQARREKRVHTQEQLRVYIQRASDYFAECDRISKPYTIAGLLLALEIDRNTWSRMGNGEHDYLLEEYLALHPSDETTDETDETSSYDETNGTPLIAYSEFHEKCTLRVQEQRERACASLRGNPAGNIFLLKAQMGLREDDAPTHVAQTLVICDGEQAKKAIEMLK